MELLRYYALVFTIAFQTVLTLPSSNSFPQGFPSVQFGHQNPVLVAPTRTTNTGNNNPSGIVENPCEYQEGSEPESDYDIGVRLSRSIYDPVSNTCYPLTRGTAGQGPCKENMKFYPRPDNPVYGFCDCDQDLPAAVYNPDTDGCHQLFQRGFCRPGQWLKLDRNQRLKCTANPCRFRNNSPIEDNSDYIVLYKEKCVELGSRCDNGTSKYATMTIQFEQGSFDVTCDSGSFASISFVGGGSLSSLECTKAGSRWSYATGTCKQTVSYAFS